MKIILFDLGDTLEHKDEHNRSVLREGAIETLKEIKALKDTNDQPPVLGLASDFGSATSPEEIRTSKEKYYNILRDLAIYDCFDPVEKNVTISAEVPETKSENLKKFIEKVIGKIGSNTTFNDIIFITEFKPHIDKANELGMKTIFLNLNNTQHNNDLPTITNLRAAVNIIKDLINQ